MDRLRAVGYGTAAAVAVFTYLSLPLLRELYGPMVDLPVYGGVALLVGVLTYGIVRRIQQYARRSEERDREAGTVLAQGEVYRVGDGSDNGGDGDGDGSGPPEDRPEVDVEVEMEQLRDEK